MEAAPEVRPTCAQPMTVCSWCRKVMAAGVLPVTHGICALCRAIYFPAKGGSA